MGGPLVLVVEQHQPDGKVCFWPIADIGADYSTGLLCRVKQTCSGHDQIGRI